MQHSELVIFNSSGCTSRRLISRSQDLKIPRPLSHGQDPKASQDADKERFFSTVSLHLAHTCPRIDPVPYMLKEAQLFFAVH